MFGSVKGEDGLSFDHFSEVLSGRLYLTALKNSLILGAWTSLFSLVLGLLLAWAVSRTDVPSKPLIQLTATLSYLSPPFLTAIALTYLFSPNAGLINVLMRETRVEIATLTAASTLICSHVKNKLGNRPAMCILR